jgi:hypothetical protein
VSENDICCERVARATAKTLTHGGAPSPYIEFRDSMPIGGIVVYELRYVTRSLTSILVEIGVAAYSSGNALTRLAVIRSAEKKKATRFAHGNSQHGTYFVRASRNDLLNSLSIMR